MSEIPRPSLRTSVALLALAALLAYGPSPTNAYAEPATPGQARAIAEADLFKDDAKFPAPPGPADGNTEAEADEGAVRDASRRGASGSGENVPDGGGATKREEAPEKEVPKEGVAPPSKKLMLTVPSLGLADVKVGDSPEQSYLDREGIMHLSGTGFPYQKGSNTYIAAHAIGYAESRVTYAFRDLEEMQNGDLVTVRDAAGKTYQYRVYESMIVDPEDTWVTEPVEGKKTITLQTCWPEPSFEKRLIVRAEIVK